MEKEPLKNENVKAKEVCKSMYTPGIRWLHDLSESRNFRKIISPVTDHVNKDRPLSSLSQDISLFSIGRSTLPCDCFSRTTEFRVCILSHLKPFNFFPRARLPPRIEWNFQVELRIVSSRQSVQYKTNQSYPDASTVLDETDEEYREEEYRLGPN